MTLRDYFASLIRTGVPVVVGLLLAKLANATGIVVDGSLIEPVLLPLCIGGYYAGVRALEARWPVAGVLLGWKVQPTYPTP